MNPQSSREETLFFAAAGMNTPEERAAFLDRECAGDIPAPQKQQGEKVCVGWLPLSNLRLAGVIWKVPRRLVQPCKPPQGKRNEPAPGGGYEPTWAGWPLGRCSSLVQSWHC